MKIRPVILCGGAGTRLWPDEIRNQAKQFIDFGGWTLLGKTLDRIKSPIFDAPIISTNSKYLKEVKKHLKKKNFKKYSIILEPIKKNTAPAILSASLIEDIPNKQPIIFLSADHLIENSNKFNKKIKTNIKNLNENNIFIFGIKPNTPSDQFGYFTTLKSKGGINKVNRFIEKPNIVKAKQLIKKGGYWNSGMFLIRKDSVINNFKRYQKNIFLNTSQAIQKAKIKKKHK